MEIRDSIYGDFIIEGVLEELIQSDAVQRLKNIHQGGACYLVNPKWNLTRYDHSVGVMLLIRKLGGSVEEQIAGLLHDISHTAFSHVVDFVLQNEKEDYHEEIYEQIIENSMIPTILGKYGYNRHSILADLDKWTLLEQPLPRLCADRIDYTLRDLYAYDQISLEEVQSFLDSLVVKDNQICINNIASGEWFTETYYKEVIDYFMDPLNIYSNGLLAEIIKLAIEKEIMTIDTLLGTDDKVTNILNNSTDEHIQVLLSRLHPTIKLEENKEDYDISLKHKVRLIDPTIVYDNQLAALSTLSSKAREMNEKAKNRYNEGTYIKFLE
ncbi:MAG: HD domain-containing protein [Bacillaceae bacterium]